MRKQKLDYLGVSAFCESMGMMLQAGIPNDEALSLLQSEGKSYGALEQALQGMTDAVRKGSSLSDAMKESGVFPRYALQMAKAGEDSGHLENILFSLSRYYADQKTITEKLHNAVTYPAAMLVLIIAVLAVMIIMVLPAFTDVYNKLTGSLAASSYGYVHWAYVLCWVALVVLVVIAVALIFGLLLWNSGRRSLVESIIRRIPACRVILDNLGTYRFTSAMSTFLASGDVQDAAVLNSIPMADCKPVEEKLKKCLAHMDEGHGFAQSAHEVELFEPVYGRMLLAGERSGSQETVLQRITELLEEDTLNQTDRLVGTVDPLLSGILMLTVALSLLSVMLPLIGMMNSVA